MIPIHLDPKSLRIGLIGSGTLTLRRLNWLRALDCEPELWAPEATPELMAAAGDAARLELPTDEDLAKLNVLWIADMPDAANEDLSRRARAFNVLVNVEDDLPHCDFHTPAIVRRGQLTVSAGTAGSSPAAAGFVRRLLEAAFPVAWGDVLSDLAALRQTMRRDGAKPLEVMAAAKARLGDTQIAQQIAPCGREDCMLLPAMRE